MAKHRQTATGRKEVGGKKKDGVISIPRVRSPVREISFVRKAGAPIHTSAAPSAASSAFPSRASSPSPKPPFRFFDLPPELRLRVYEMMLICPTAVDLDPVNYRAVLPRLALFLVSRQMYEEAYRVFYAQPIRLFPHPYSGKFYNTKKPLLQRLPVKYREVITCMELRVGAGWSKPPACQDTTNPALGLADCVNLRTLKVFVECDPSDNIFTGFRGKFATEETYKYFCINLLLGILENVPSLETVEIDAYPSVKRDAPLVTALVKQIQHANKKLTWGPLRGWDVDDLALTALAELISGMSSVRGPPAATPVVEVQA